MVTPRKKTTVRLDYMVRLKIEYIADMSGRSMSRQIEQVLKDHIKEYEEEHGTILLPTDTPNTSE